MYFVCYIGIYLDDKNKYNWIYDRWVSDLL